MKKIITIGRQLGSGGRTIAQLVAKHLECQFYDRELLNLAARESGFSEEVFEKTDERRSLFRSFGTLTSFLTPHSSISASVGDYSPEGLFKFQSDAIRKAAEQGSCVFVGRCADYVLRDFPEMISVFVTADIEERVMQVSSRHHCEEQEALRIIHHQEDQRASYYNYYTGKRWGDASSYHLCINSSRLGLEKTAEYIEQFIEQSLACR